MVMGVQYDIHHWLLTCQGWGKVAEMLQEKERGYLALLRVSAWCLQVKERMEGC